MNRSPNSSPPGGTHHRLLRVRRLAAPGAPERPEKENFAGPALLIVDDGEKLHLATHCGDAALAAGLKAGDLLRDLAALAGGKGGGKPDQARGAAPERAKLAELEAAAKAKLG